MVRSRPLAELFSALAQSGYSKSTRPRASTRREAPGGAPALSLLEQRTDSFFLLALCSHINRAPVAHRAPPTGVTQLDRSVIAGDIRATIFLQTETLDVSDGVHVL